MALKNNGYDARFASLNEDGSVNVENLLSLIDNIVEIDLISFIPSNVKEVLHLSKIGASSLFSILFVVFEILSVLKNMVLCKLPIPKKLQAIFEKLMKDLTEEIKENK